MCLEAKLRNLVMESMLMAEKSSSNILIVGYYLIFLPKGWSIATGFIKKSNIQNSLPQPDTIGNLQH
jgi:hypothetical protein